MMDDEISALASLLREAERPVDEAFVSDLEWLLDLDCAFEQRRRATLRRWMIDLGSACAVGGVAYVLASPASTVLSASSTTFFGPLLAATAVPVLWLLARGSHSTA